MQNCSPPNVAVDVIYDLKGSTANRSVLSPPVAPLFSPRPSSHDLLEQNGPPPLCDPLVALKDNDLQVPIQLDTEAVWCSLKGRLERDSEFLRQHGLGDYSLLVVLGDPDSESETDSVATGSSPKPEDLKRTDTALKLSSLLQTFVHRFKPPPSPKEGAVPEEPPPCPDSRCWRPLPCADGSPIYLSIIDFLSPWSSLNIGSSLSIPHGRVLEYAVMKHFKPGASLVPPDQYQERFARHVVRKFTFPGQDTASSEDLTLSPTSGRSHVVSPVCLSPPASLPGSLLDSFCGAFSPSSGNVWSRRARSRSFLKAAELNEDKDLLHMH